MMVKITDKRQGTLAHNRSNRSRRPPRRAEAGGAPRGEMPLPVKRLRPHPRRCECGARPKDAAREIIGGPERPMRAGRCGKESACWLGGIGRGRAGAQQLGQKQGTRGMTSAARAPLRCAGVELRAQEGCRLRLAPHTPAAAAAAAVLQSHAEHLQDQHVAPGLRRRLRLRRAARAGPGPPCPRRPRRLQLLAEERVGGGRDGDPLLQGPLLRTRGTENPSVRAPRRPVRARPVHPEVRPLPSDSHPIRR